MYSSNTMMSKDNASSNNFFFSFTNILACIVVTTRHVENLNNSGCSKVVSPSEGDMEQFL